MSVRYTSVFLFIIILFLPFLARSQPKTEDVIYLKDGGVMRGRIIEYVGDMAIKIETAGRNVFVVKLEDVREVTTEALSSLRLYKSSGYINQTGLAILPGSESTPLRIETVHGYQLTSRFSAGLGIGFIAYKDPLNLVPMFIDLRYKLLKANFTPVFYLKSGISLTMLPDGHPLVGGHRGGFMMNPGIGFQLHVKRDFGLYLTSGYLLDNASYWQEEWGGRIITNKIQHRRLEFGFGFTF